MKKEQSETDPGSDLRRMAEERLKDSKSNPASLGAEESRDALALVHELQVHQIELEMQNEELKRSKLEAEDALARYSDLYDFAPVGLFTIDVGGRILEANLAGAALLGMEKNILLRKRFEQFVLAEDRHLLDELSQQAFRTGVKQTCELRLLRREGAEVYVRIECTAANDSLSNNKEFRLAAIDVSERKRAEEALSQSERLYHSIGESINYGVWVCDPDGRNTYASESFLKLLGITQEQCSNFGWGDTLHPEDAERTMAAWKECVRTRGVWDLEHRFLGKDGQWHDILARGVPVKNDSGKIVCWAGINLDISRLKHAEEELRKALDELELRVEERTAELLESKQKLESVNAQLHLEIEQHRQAENALLKAKEFAEAAVKAKSEFMANMSHEIRTPMNAVIGMTSLLLDDESLDSDQKDFIETIRTSGDALMVIINDILDFSKMEREKTVLEEQPFDIRSCIEEAIDLIAIQANEKKLNLSYRIDENVPEAVLGDPSRVRQILINLLNNACKFTDEGEVKLSVSSETFSDTHEIHFAVQDTGIGISPRDMEKLFKSFSQVETSSTRSYGGMGLGLAISKKLVELMGGRIWAESEPGKGSTFHFTIIAKANRDAKPVLKIVQPQLVGKHVLIVDDNKTNRRTLGLQIYSWGMVPQIASSGQDALNWIRRGDDFDLVLLDERVADINVLEFAAEIRNIKRALPIVLLTSMGRHETPDLFTAILTKPIKLAQLYAILLELLAKKQTAGSFQANDHARTESARSPRILLAEDNASSQKVILAMLKRLGYRADTVANGIEALQALDRQHYDIVLMDVRMPEMGGLDATRIIRQRWPDNGPKVIAVTAFALKGDMKRCLDSGMDDYLSKPVKIGDLAEVLNKYFP